MPQSTLSYARVCALLPTAPAPEELESTLFVSKAEVAGRQDDALAISVTPDRLDLLSEGGLALHLQGALGSAQGLPRLRRTRAGARGLSVVREPSVDPIRPHIAAVVVRAPTGAPLDDGLLAEAVRFQEVLHATIGRDRRAMSLGIYPARRLEGPIRYALEPLESVGFVPLHESAERPAKEFFAADPMAARYGGLGRVDERCLTLRDARGSVLSLPPVLNSATAGEARVGERRLLLESTGRNARAVSEGLGLLLVVFAARGWAVEPVPVRDGDRTIDDGNALLAPPSIALSAATLRAIAGETWSTAEVVERLGRARLGCRRAKGGWTIGRPPWRPDLQTAVDIAEDIVLAREPSPASGVVPASPTRGRRRPESRWRRRVARLLLGLGFTEVHTPLLVSAEVVDRVGGSGPLRLAHPVSAELAYVRDRLLLSHLGVLSRNRRHGYPQRFAEVGAVLRSDPASESGGTTAHHAALVEAGEGTGFADVAARVDYLLRSFDVGSVREPAELPGTIPGRAARVRVAGEVVAELGELAPALLTAYGVPVPAAWAEVDLSALWPLTGGKAA